MKPTHYHTGVSGRIRFVTLSGKKGEWWTSDGYKSSTVDLKPVKRLIGKRVSLNGHSGTIMDVTASTRPEFLPGKYIADGKYLTPKDLSQYNDCVRVHWDSGSNSVWQSAYKLKFL